MRGIFSKLLGDKGERLAERFLCRQGFQILARQYRSAFGEIDLICRDGRWLVFVEVKTRQSDAAGQPFEAITHEKQRKLTRLALAYLKEHRLLEHSARFDVVSIVWTEGVKEPAIEHYRNAFEAVGRGQMFS